MKMIKTDNLLKPLTLSAMLMTLAACSSDPAPWTKNESPWDQRRGMAAEAPAADTYKADLEMVQPASEVELSYQAESVESFAPEAAAETEALPVELDMQADAATEAAMDVPTSLNDYPANYFTVQLMASVDIDRVYRFADAHQLSTQFVVATRRDGITWHVLLLDVYPSYAEAVVAKDDIASLIGTQPWVRSVGSVQKLMQ